MESIRDIKQNNNRNPHEFHAENIPAALKDQDAWILWHGKWNEKGKLEKTPYAVRGGMAKSTGPETWTTYERAAEAASKRNDVLGLGFVFAPESAFGGVDLDGCRNPETGEIKAWAQEIIDATPTYAEVSPSLTGIKLVGMFKLPPMSGHKKILNEETGEAIEVYDQGRFFTVTGRQIPGTPSEVRNIQIPVEGVLGRYFAKPQRAEKPAYKPQQIRELTDKEQDEATQAIADNLPESHLNDLALDISGYLGRKTHRETSRRS
jgi:putative DNA primase/helicase